MTVVYMRALDLGTGRTPAELSTFRSAEVRRLLADCLGERYGAHSWSLAKNEEGKPYLTSSDGLSLPPQISLSHSGKWVACALSDHPVGVDVQEVRDISFAVFKRFLPDVDLSEADARVKTMHWTRYEACLKRYGSRLAMVTDAEVQRYDSCDLDDAVVTVCHGDDAVEWVSRGRF